MRKPLLIAHMRTQQHGEDEFIHNKPEFQDSSKDNNNMQTITTNDTVAMEDDDDIIYLSVNDKGFIEDDDCIDDDIDIDDDDDGDGHFVVSGWIHSFLNKQKKNRLFFLLFSMKTFIFIHSHKHIAHIKGRAYRG